MNEPRGSSTLRGLAPLVALGSAAVIALSAGACTNEPFDPENLPNRPPIATTWLESAEPDSINATSYNNATFFWSGTDPDGFVQGFHVAISAGEEPPIDWIFTTDDESTTTYSTDENGNAFPTLHVVAEDDRGALSDTVRTTIPLKNFPPVLEFLVDFTPLKQTFGTASFKFFGFDLDGAETLEPYAEYRFEGSDPQRVFDIGDPDADPALGWVRVEKPPTRFDLLLQNIPGGDPGADFDQTLYVRIADEAGATSDFSYTWQVFEVLGEVLLIDDMAVEDQSRDAFYRDALDTHLPGAYSVWDISSGLPERDDDLWQTLEQFRLIVWYTGNGESANVVRAQGLVERFLTEDLDPAVDGVQSGKLYLEMPTLVGNNSHLSPSFRSNVVGIGSQPDPRFALVAYATTVQNAIGDLDILSQRVDVPDLVSVGKNYLDDSGRYFGLTGLAPLSGTGVLWRFESYRWGGSGDPLCRTGCEPVVAVRLPETGLAKTVCLGFQLEFANATANAIDVVGILLRDHLGHEIATP